MHGPSRVILGAALLSFISGRSSRAQSQCDSLVVAVQGRGDAEHIVLHVGARLRVEELVRQPRRVRRRTTDGILDSIVRDTVFVAPRAIAFSDVEAVHVPRGRRQTPGRDAALGFGLGLVAGLAYSSRQLDGAVFQTQADLDARRDELAGIATAIAFAGAGVGAFIGMRGHDVWIPVTGDALQSLDRCARIAAFAPVVAGVLDTVFVGTSTEGVLTLRRGSRVKLELNSWQGSQLRKTWLLGAVDSLKADSLFLAGVGAPWARINRLEVSVGRMHRSGEYAIVGASIGFITGMAVGASVDANPEDKPIAVAFVGALGGALGTATGALLGLPPRERWVAVDLDLLRREIRRGP